MLPPEKKYGLQVGKCGLGFRAGRGAEGGERGEKKVWTADWLPQYKFEENPKGGETGAPGSVRPVPTKKHTPPLRYARKGSFAKCRKRPHNFKPGRKGDHGSAGDQEKYRFSSRHDGRSWVNNQ